MVEELFQLLPEDIKSYLKKNGNMSDFPYDLNNYFDYIGEGADREVFALNDDYVVKFERSYDSDQNWAEYDTYQEIKDYKLSTKIIGSPDLIEMGLIFAERVIPMEEYFHNILGNKLYGDGRKGIRLIDYVNDFDLSLHGIDFLLRKLKEAVREDILEELGSFADAAQVHGLLDIHSGNIGVSEDGHFLALDLGYGSGG